MWRFALARPSQSCRFQVRRDRKYPIATTVADDTGGRSMPRQTSAPADRLTPPRSKQMVRQRLAAVGIEGRGLSLEEAAAYVGLSPGAFLKGVVAGIYPGALPQSGEREIWDRVALYRALDARQALTALRPARPMTLVTMTSKGRSAVSTLKTLPKYVFRQERNNGRVYYYFRRHGLYTRLPDDPASAEFAIRYGQLLESIRRPSAKVAKPGSIKALIAEFKQAPEFNETRAEDADRLCALPREARDRGW